MANNKSAMKRERQAEVRRLRNRTVRSITRTMVTRARDTVDHHGPDSEEQVRQAQSTLDIGVRKGVIHPNNAARRKSRLMKRLNAALAAG